MKRHLILALFLLTAGTAWAQNSSLAVYFKFVNVVEGYDHDCKTQVFIDGELVGTSGVVRETQGESVVVPVSKGRHEIRIVNWALYEGTWEEHTVANNYSFDAIYEGQRTIAKKKEKLYLVFDVDNGPSHSWGKKKKK